MGGWSLGKSFALDFACVWSTLNLLDKRSCRSTMNLTREKARNEIKRRVKTEPDDPLRVNSVAGTSCYVGFRVFPVVDRFRACHPRRDGFSFRDQPAQNPRISGIC